MKSRKVGKAVDRNYSVELWADGLQTTYNSNGTIRSQQAFRQPSDTARLVVNNPWRQHKPAGLDPTARTLSHFSRRCAQVTASYGIEAGRRLVRYGPDTQIVSDEWNARYLNTGDLGPNNQEQLRTEAILDAMQKVKDQKWNAGVALAESAGVASMAQDAMQLVAKLRQDLRKGDFRKAYQRWKRANSKHPNFESYPAWRRKHWQEVRHVKSVRRAKRIPQGWLYYNFGLIPTINDITDAADAFATRLNPLFFGLGDNTLVVDGYAKQTTKRSLHRYFPRQFNHRVEFSSLYSVRVKLPVRPKAKYVAKLSELGVTNPAEAVYNGTPFSWVADYFTTFGDWLSVLDTSLGWVWGEKWTESWRLVAKSTMTPISNANMQFAATDQPSTITHKSLNRVVKVGLYGPMGSILPTWKRKGPSAKQVANMASVVSQMFKVRVHP